MDNQQSKQTGRRKDQDQPVVSLAEILRCGIVRLDRVEKGNVYYNARFKFMGYDAVFQFPVKIEDRDEKFVFLSIEKVNVFRDNIRLALDYNLVKQVY